MPFRYHRRPETQLFFDGFELVAEIDHHYQQQHERDRCQDGQPPGILFFSGGLLCVRIVFHIGHARRGFLHHIRSLYSLCTHTANCPLSERVKRKSILLCCFRRTGVCIFQCLESDQSGCFLQINTLSSSKPHVHLCKFAR